MIFKYYFIIELNIEMGCVNSLEDTFKNLKNREAAYLEEATKPFPLDALQKVNIGNHEWIEDEAGDLCGGCV